MKPTNTSKIIKSYFWQFLSIIVRFLSMFIVTPYLTKNPLLYGVYMVCMSLTIFLSFVDLGFINAGFKYASESVAQKDKQEEIAIVGFTSFMLLIFSIFYMLFLAFVIVKPTWILTQLPTHHISIAVIMIAIMLVFTPSYMLNRMVQLIYGIHLEDFLFQRIIILFNIFSIISVFFFFKGSHYHLIDYFIFYHLMNFCANIIGLGIALHKYHYPVSGLLRAVRFSKEVYLTTKTLAFSTLYGSLIWFVYFEIDLIMISKILGGTAVALIAPAMTLTNFARVLTSAVLFGPFQARFNYATGLKDETDLKEVYLRTIFILLPIVVLPLLSIIFLMKPFMMAWVGQFYQSSILMAQLLIGSYLLVFIGNPSSIILNAKVKVREINIAQTLICVVYWIAIFLLIRKEGILVFPITKWITFTCLILTSSWLCKKTLNIPLKKYVILIKEFWFPLILFILCLVGVTHLLPIGLSKWHLLLVICSGGLVSCFGFLMIMVTSKMYRKEVFQILGNIRG